MSARQKVVLTIPVSRVKVHPKNPRRDAVADAELVASVAESGITTPLLVAVDLSKCTTADVQAYATGVRPMPAGQHVHVIALDGHRRRDAAKKAKLKDVTVVIDLGLDTETEQIKAMLLANTLREGLSPVEVAESYQGLLDLGLRQGDVAKAMGRKPREISAQLKVLKLATTTQAKVHTGVLTLDDAAGLLEFTDDPVTTKRLEVAAESGADFRYQLARARARRDAEQETAAQVAALEQAGVPFLDFTTWQNASWETTRRVDQVPGAHADPPLVHDGCHAYAVTPASEHQPARVVELCTDVAKHAAWVADTKSDLHEKRAAALEASRLEIEERQAAADAAAKVRLTVLRDLAGQDLKLSGPLEQLVRGLLPGFLAMLEDFGSPARYEDILGLDEGERWSTDRGYGSTRDTKVIDHLDRIGVLSKAGLGRHLAAGLLAMGEWALDAATEDDAVFRAYAGPYVDLLEAHGYEFGGPDAARRDLVRQADDANDTDDTPAAAQGDA